MNKILFTAFLLFAALPFTRAQDVTGTWMGTLSVPTGKLRVVFHVSGPAGNLTGKMDSPDQQVSGIPISKLTFEAPTLHIEVANGIIVYDGRLQGDSIQGEFRQSGQVFPLTMHKAEIKDEEVLLNRPQEPKPPFPYKSEDVQFINKKADNIRLAGTLTLPDSGKNFPAVVLISGSGPQDRDETLMGHKPFWVIADYLTRRGIAVLRFDDRGTAQSQGNFQASTSADFATDVEAAVQFLKSRKEIDPKKIGLIGHSEGGIIAPMVAAGDKSIDFIVLLAGTGYNGADLLVMQNEALGKAAGMSPEQLKAAATINKKLYALALTAGSDTATRRELLDELTAVLPANLTAEQKQQMAEAQIAQFTSPWMVYFLKNNPVDYLTKVKCPVLAINGSKDLQVPADRNIPAIEKALKEGGNNRVTTKIFPDLNHLFQHAKTGLPTEYRQIEETIAPEVLEYIANWIKKQTQ